MPGWFVGRDAALDTEGEDDPKAVSLTNLERLSISGEMKVMPLSLRSRMVSWSLSITEEIMVAHTLSCRSWAVSFRGLRGTATTYRGGVTKGPGLLLIGY